DVLDANSGGEVEDGFHALDLVLYERGIEDRPVDEADFVEPVLDVGRLPRREVVEDGDVVAVVAQPVDEVRTDEPGSAGDEDPQSSSMVGNVMAGTRHRASTLAS